MEASADMFSGLVLNAQASLDEIGILCQSLDGNGSEYALCKVLEERLYVRVQWKEEDRDRQ